jgi:ketosteroid isomerase-like protein
MKPLMKPHRLYPPQDPQALGRYYTDHVAGMTEAGLDGKAEIAEQLAWRDKRIAELETKLERETWRANENGNYASGHFDLRLAAENRAKELEAVAREAAAMLAETNHGGLTHARSESVRDALVKAGVEIPAQCSACPHEEPQ